MYIGHAHLSFIHLFLQTPLSLCENIDTQVISLRILYSVLLPGFTLSTPISIFPDKVNRGHPSSVKNKHQNMSPPFFLSSHSLLLLRLAADFAVCQSVQTFFFFFWGFWGLSWQPKSTYASESSQKYKRESPGKVADPLVTLSPRGEAAALAVCVFDYNLWSRWLES